MAKLFHSFTRILILAVFFAALASNAQTAGVLIFGPEWTFTHDKFLPMHPEESAVRHYVDDVRDRFDDFCRTSSKCRFDRFGGHGLGEIIFADGLKVRIGVDPGVIELQATPLSLDAWKKVKNQVQEVIFDQLALENFKPHVHEGAGHINIGLEYFKDKPMLLRNFIVDFYNNPGVSVVLNSLNDNHHNAQTLDQMPQDVRDHFIRSIEKLDKIPNFKIDDVLKIVGDPLVSKYIALGIRDVGYRPGEKKAFMPSFIGLRSISRLEVRTVRPQANMEWFERALEIFDARIKNHLVKFDAAIPLAPARPIEDGYVALGQYADYIEESGLKLKDYKLLMPQIWQKLAVKDYIRKPKYKIKKAARAGQCQALF